jgi:hypothetical protein
VTEAAWVLDEPGVASDFAIDTAKHAALPAHHRPEPCTRFLWRVSQRPPSGVLVFLGVAQGDPQHLGGLGLDIEDEFHTPKTTLETGVLALQ